MHKNNALFITYNGLLDQLGSSQILPYIQLIANHPRRVHILSFEKNIKNSNKISELKSYLANKNIDWTYLEFTSGYGKVGKIIDLFKMYTVAIWLQIKYRFAIVHARSLHAAQVGLLLKTLFGNRLIFDMRGLWVDERIDGGIWSQDKRIDRILYTVYKKIERKALKKCDALIVLTHRVIIELANNVTFDKSKITVVPCCADYNHFKCFSKSEKTEVRLKLGIDPSSLVICYLGSLGTWYMLDKMLLFFEQVKLTNCSAKFLIVTKDWSDDLESAIKQLNLAYLRADIIIKSATRDEVVPLLACSDLMISFILPSFSKLASSPTKMAESFASGVPVICNAGIGDVEMITDKFKTGAVINKMSIEGWLDVVKNLDYILSLGGVDLRERTSSEFSLTQADELYRSVYKKIEPNNG